MTIERGRLAGTNLAAEPGVAFSGGNTAPGLGLANLVADGLVSYPCRFLGSGTLANTAFVVDLGRRCQVDMVALLAHTMGPSARYRLTLATDPGFSQGVQSSGWAEAQGRVHASSTRAWEDSNFWDGRPTARELDAYGRRVVHTMSPAWSGRYLRVELDDTANAGAAGGTLDVGGLFVAKWIVPEFNFSRDAEQGLEFRTVVEETPSGRQIFDTRKSARTYSVPYPLQGKTTWAQLLDVAMMNGPERPVFFAPTLSDPANLFREAFPCRLVEGVPGGYAGGFRRSTSLSLREVIE